MLCVLTFHDRKYEIEEIEKRKVRLEGRLGLLDLSKNTEFHTKELGFYFLGVEGAGSFN